MNNQLKAEKDGISRFAALTFLLSVLLPEYIAPFMTLVLFIKTLKKTVKDKKTPDFGDIGTVILSFMLLMVIMTVKSSSIITSLSTIGIWLLMFFGYYSFTEAVRSEESVETIFRYGSYTAGIGGLVGVLQFIIIKTGNKTLMKYTNPFWRILDLLIQKIISFLPESVKGKMPSTKFHTFAGRSCGTLSNPLFFATLEIALFPFAAYMFLYGKTKNSRILGLVCLILSLAGIATSYSRAPYVYAVIVFLLLFLYGKKHFKKLGAVLISSGLFVAIFGREFVVRLSTVTNANETSVSTRTKVWKSAFDMLKHKPIFGYGTGFGNTRDMLHNVYKVKQPHAHNIFLEVWIETGILGLIIMISLFVVSGLILLSMYKKGGNAKTAAVTLFASLAGFGLCGMTDCIFYGLKPLQYMTMVLALITVSSRIYTQRKDKTNAAVFIKETAEKIKKKGSKTNEGTVNR